MYRLVKGDGEAAAPYGLYSGPNGTSEAKHMNPLCHDGTGTMHWGWVHTLMRGAGIATLGCRNVQVKRWTPALKSTPGQRFGPEQLCKDMLACCSDDAKRRQLG